MLTSRPHETFCRRCHLKFGGHRWRCDTLRLSCVRRRERESDAESSDVILHTRSFLHVKWGLTANCGNRRRFHRLPPVPSFWSSRFTPVPRLPPVLEKVTSMKCWTVSARCPAHRGAPHGRAIVSTSRFR